jgi:PKD repeat protein
MRLLAVPILAVTALLAGGSGPAHAAVTCPSPNPVVQENNCAGAGTTDWRLANPSENVAGFATQTSFNLGQDVPLKIARNAPVMPATKVDISVYRLGYYGNTGSRLIAAASRTGVTVNNDFTCNPRNAQTGYLDCGNWGVTYTIPGASLPASGVYLAKIRATDTGIDNHVMFVVRDDNRASASKVLFVLPTASYQAYNNWGGKSLYWDRLGLGETVAGTQRAVKVSFNRPIDTPTADHDRIRGPDRNLIVWLEQQGYDVAYTDSLSVHQNPAQLRAHAVVALGAHDEYMSGETVAALKAARDAGTSIINFGSNTGYWKVRYEDGGRTLVCYKTVQGSGSEGSGTVTPNDPGPDGVTGTADDALGADRTAGTADDRPDNATTTFRDNGAPPGDPNAPPGGRVGPDQPENSLFGVMYIGDNQQLTWAVRVPPANAGGEFAGDRAWRNTGISSTAGGTAGSSDTIGWEWDGVPSQAQYLSKQPAGVKRLSDTDTRLTSSNWIQDEGRVYTHTPPPGQGLPNIVRYRAASGAWVFSAASNQYGYGLGEAKLSQLTYNVISDMGVQPGTPSGLVTDAGNQAPRAVATASPTSGPLPLNVSFNGSGSSDPDGTITKYEWDLDGNGSFGDSTAVSPSFTYTQSGTYNVRLRVTDNGGVTDITTVTISAGSTPDATISTPAAGTSWKVGDSIAFAGSATDDNGAAIPASGLAWRLDLVQCAPSGGACQTSLVQSASGVASGSFTAPQAQYPAYLELRLTATDSHGLQTTVTRRLDPRTVALTLDSDPAGLKLTLGSETLTGPFTRDVVVGSSNTVTAVSPQSQGLSNYVFGSWSDGGAQTHTITAPATATTYKATYSAATVGATLVGTETVGPDVDNAPAGMAEAFRTTASTTGPVSWLTVYLDSSATASELVAGLYADASGKPGALLTSGRLTSPAAGAWNRILVPSANVTAGGTYWIAILGPAGKAGTMRFRDTLNGTGRAESSSSSTLTDLPTTWSTGTAYNDGPLSAYGAAAGGAAQPAVLAVAPSSLAFSGTAGAANPAAKTLSVTNTGGGSLSFTASDDAPWLSVTPASGSAPRDLSVSVDTTGLAAGSYSATVTVTSTGTSGSPKQIPVTLTVAAAPALSVTPASLSFSATAGGASPASKTLSVANSGGGTLSFTAADDAPWLSVTPASGTAPRDLTVSADVSGLAAGTYTGKVTVTSSGSSGSPKDVPVTFTVDPAAATPTLAVSPSTLSFSSVAGGADPASKTFSVTNTGTGSLSFTTSDDAPWLSATPGSGTAPQDVAVSADTTGLAAGTYTGKVTVTAAGAAGSPKDVAVTLVVNPPPALAVTPASLAFSGTEGGANPAAKTLSVTNTGGGSLSFTAGDDATWLTVTPASGSAPQTLTVSASLSGLAAGTYTGNVTVTAAGVQGSPKSIPVTLTVAAAPSGLVGAYGFEEAAGTTATDSSGLGNTGVINGPARVTTGKFGRALTFDGVNDLVTIPDSASLDITRMTLEAWVRPTVLGTAWRSVLLKEQPGDFVYALYATTNASRPSGYVFIGGEKEARGTAALTVNTWTHLATTYDGANLRLYVNGTLVKTTAQTGNIATSSGALQLGGNTIWGEWYAGTLDDVRVYNKALTAAEIQADMTRGAG